MRIWQQGKLTILFFCIFSLAACVPVEEKQEATFDVSLSRPDMRRIYNLQSRQEKDSLLALVQSEDPSIRYAVARAFASYQDSASLEFLLPLLMDPHVDVRAMAAEAVGLIGSPDAEAQLTAAFDGRDSARLYEKANASILEAMGRVGSARFLHALSTISNYQHIDTLLLLGQVRGIYRYALRDMVDPDGTATMVRYLFDKSMPYDVRLMAAQYLHRATQLDLTPYAQQIITGWHGESDPFLRICLATALGKLKTNEAKQLLINSLQTESDYRVKSNMLRALQTFAYDDIRDVMIEFSKSSQPPLAEIAAQYFVTHGKEKDAALYRTTMEQAKTWQAKTRLAEATNKNMTSIFAPSKTSIQNQIQQNLQNASQVYEKAAWLKAWASELRNFESLPKYMTAEQPPVIRTQAVQSLIDASKDKNFDAFFAGEGHLIRSQIGGYLANAMRTGDAGVLALIAAAITDPATGLKAVMEDRANELSKAMDDLELPQETETYLELQKALREYGIDKPGIPEEKKSVKPIDWTLIDRLKNETRITMRTSKGDITISLFPERAPGSVANFIQLADQGFYNQKAFHRVVPNFVIQSGCPRGDGYGSLDFTIRSELAGAYYNDEGYIGMASAGPHTEGTQFFITHSPAPHLDGRYTIFGKVILGMDVVHRITMDDTIEGINIVY